jgi:hypothetical protein
VQLRETSGFREYDNLDANLLASKGFRRIGRQLNLIAAPVPSSSGLPRSAAVDAAFNPAETGSPAGNQYSFS